MTTRKATPSTSTVPPAAVTPSTEQIEKIERETEPRATKPTKSIGKLFDNTTLIVLNFEGVGNSRKIRTSQLQAQAEFDESVVNTSKKLFKCAEYLAIKRNEAETRAYINGRSMPSYFQRGMYLCKNTIIPSIDEKLIELKAKRAELTEAFIKKYDEIVAEMKTKQGDLFNPKDYPSADVVRSRFTMDWHYVVFSVAGNLEGMNAALFQREKQKVSAMWNEATNEMTMLLRESMKELVDHLVDKLSPAADGSKKIFKPGNMIENFTEFFNTFDDRNLMEDDQLKTLVSEAKQLMEGVDADELRDSKRTRKQIVDGFSQIKTKLDAMLVETTDRGFSFENL